MLGILESTAIDHWPASLKLTAAMRMAVNLFSFKRIPFFPLPLSSSRSLFSHGIIDFRF